MATPLLMGTLSPARFRRMHPVYTGRVGLQQLPEEQAVLLQQRTRTRLVTRSDTSEAGAVVTEQPASQIPSAKALLLFALPTLVLPLADPVMSLIDTICIGSYGTVVELAATGPASLLFASASQLFSAFSATALADISRALAKGDRVEASDAFAKAIRDAAIAGGFVMVLFGVFHLQLIQALNVSPDVVPTAARYLAIRAFAAPAATASAVLAASLLAQHDNRSPCIIVAASSVFSLICDVTLIVYFRLGLTGAAASTVVTQYLGLAALIHACMLPGRLMPTIPEFRFPRFSVPDVPKMIPKLPWVGSSTTAVSSTDSVDLNVTGAVHEELDAGGNEADSRGSEEWSLDSFQRRPGGRGRVETPDIPSSSAAVSPSSLIIDASATQTGAPKQQEATAAVAASEGVLKATGTGEAGGQVVGSAPDSGSSAGGSVDAREPALATIDSADDSDDVSDEESSAMSSREFLDPRLDGVSLEWDEYDDFDALRSVEADVALTLQATANPAGMGAMLPWGGNETEEEDEEEGVQLEGRMGYAGSSLSIDDTDSTASLDLVEASSDSVEVAEPQAGNADNGRAESTAPATATSGDSGDRSRSNSGDDLKVQGGAQGTTGRDGKEQSLSTSFAAADVPGTRTTSKSGTGSAKSQEVTSSTEASRDTSSAALSDVASGALAEAQTKVSAFSEAAAGDGVASLQGTGATGAASENGDGAGAADVDEWSGSSGTSRNISVTFARSVSVDTTFSSSAEASGKEKEKKKSGGGGLALAAVYAAKLGCYFIVQGAAMRLSVVELAAHNAVFSIWNACAYFPVPLQTTALAFVPACNTFPELAKVTRVITVAAVSMTVPLAIMCASVPLFVPHLLTADPKVAACMRSLAPIAAGSILACTLDVACEGLLVAQGKLRQLLVTMCGVLTLVGVYFYTGRGLTITGTWGGLLLFFGLRSMLSAGGVAWQFMSSRRAAQEEAEAQERSRNEASEMGEDEGSAEASSQAKPQLAPA